MLFLFISNKWYQAEWTGFGKDSTVSEEETLQNGRFSVSKRITRYESGKTLWDWLGLAGVIAIPVALFLLQQKQQKTTDTNLREEALRDYIDKIAELLIDKELKVLLKDLLDKNIAKDDPKLDAALDVARARTLSILRRLEGDKKRKSNVVHFLIDAELVEKQELLKGADLSKINLSKLNLSTSILSESNFKETNFQGANLSSADLSEANLSNAFLMEANLSGAAFLKANLSNAFLMRANLSGATFLKANLSNAFFMEADLSGANFQGAENLTPKQIKEANTWKEAIYDPEFRKQLGLPPETTP